VEVTSRLVPNGTEEMNGEEIAFSIRDVKSVVVVAAVVVVVVASCGCTSGGAVDAQ